MRRILFTLLILVTACDKSHPPTVELLPVPTLDLTGAEAGARQQLEETRKRLDDSLSLVGAKPLEAAEAFGQLGLLYVTYEFLEPAAVCFENASRLAQEDYRWTYLLGYLNKIQGRLDAAEEGFEKTLSLEADYVPAILRLAQTHLELGRLDQAREGFQQAAALQPSSAVAQEGLGKVAVAGGDFQGAVGRFEQALSLDASATALHYALGQAYRNLGDEEKAEFHLRLRGDVAPRVADPLLNPLASVAASAQFFLVQGAEALEDGELASAEASYRLALEREPTNLMALRGLALSLEGQGDLASAVAVLEKGLEVLEGQDPADFPAEAQLLAILGEALSRVGRVQEAAYRFRQSLILEVDQPRVRLQWADALARSGRVEEAVQLYDQLLSETEKGDRASLYIKRATARINLGHREQALEDFREAAEAAPQDPRPRWRWADALEFLGDGAEAQNQRAAARRLVPSGSDGAALLVEEGGRRARRGALAAAAQSYRRALELDAVSTPARVGLGQVLLAQSSGEGPREDKAREAEKLFREALEQTPRSAPAHHGLIRSLLLAGRFGEGRVALQEGLRAFPRDQTLALTQVRLLAACPDPSVRDGGLSLEIGLRVFQVAPSLAAAAALALSQAEKGNLEEAQALQARLLEDLPLETSATVRALMVARLKSFQAGRTWTAGSGEELLGLLDP